MVILVTGSRGFLGRAVVDRLRAEMPSAEIVSVCRRPADTVAGIREIQGDLRDIETWKRLPKEVTHVVHLAAVLPWGANEPPDANLQMARYLARRCADWPRLHGIVFASTISVYGSPQEEMREEMAPADPTPYGIAKREAEAVLGGAARTVSLRFSSIYGPGQGKSTVVPFFIRRARAGEPLAVFGDGTRTQDFVYVEDAVRAVGLALRSGVSGPLNIGSGHATTMLELAQAVAHEFGEGKCAVVLDEARRETAPSIRVSIDRAPSALRYEPEFPLARGLRAYHECLDLQGRP